jgi:hypothetical protein
MKAVVITGLGVSGLAVGNSLLSPGAPDWRKGYQGDYGLDPSSYRTKIAAEVPVGREAHFSKRDSTPPDATNF